MDTVLFVCTGNICRSPTAEGVFRKMAADRGLEGATADSAGTISYHAGNPPDPRAVAAALRRGVDLRTLRARKVRREDFTAFRHILAMDQENLETLVALSPPRHRARVRLFLSFAPAAGCVEVPDPYYGGPEGFERALDLIEEGCRGLLDHLGPAK